MGPPPTTDGPEPEGSSPSARKLLALAVPAALIGIGCSLLLLIVSVLAERLQDLLWDGLPGALGVSDSSVWWPIVMLTATGTAVGLVVWKAPGHAGPDPATEGLVSPPMPAGAVPGLLAATMLALAGGVSLGPENPITGANIALAAALGLRLLPRVQPAVWVALAAAGTIGALFGTPVAAALILSEMPVGRPGVPLWNRLFAPLVAAGAGALTTVSLAQPTFSIDVPDYPGFEPVDLATGSVIAMAACLIGLAAVYAFPHVHAAFQRIGHPVARIALGGLLLGLAGAIGGRITLFKGLEQMKELSQNAAAYTAWGLVLIVAVKTAALLIAASCGFRGGRIFPAVFAGLAVGLLAHAVAGSVPTSLAIGCGVLGLLVAVTRQGWLSLFMAVTVVTEIELLPVLCVVVLPAWLLAVGRPQMLLDPGPAAAK